MAERVASMSQANLRLQLRHVVIGEHHHYRFARENGWHCGHWHKTIEQAAECIELKLWKP